MNGVYFADLLQQSVNKPKASFDSCIYIYTHTYAFSSIHFMSSNIGYIKANTKVVIWTYLLGPLWMGGIFCDNTERNNKLLHVPTSRAYGIA